MKSIPFMSLRYYAYVISLLLLILSLLSLFYKGLNLGLDFTGGSVLEVKFEKPVKVGEVRRLLEEARYSHFQVQDTAQGTVIVKLRLGDPTQPALEKLKTLSNYELIRSESIGGIITSELRQKAIWAMLIAIFGILLYLGYRFEPLWAFGAIIALAHDVLIVVGAYSITQREVNLDVVAALLIVAGYSVSDTVVVFDRIRENLRIRKGTPFRDLIDISINQTLARTIMTSLTTFVVSLMLFMFGGPALSNIMFSFVVGVVVGTLSSIFVASALVFDIKSRFRAQPVGV
ncbi:protein translocase subunit SecF [Pampinifervens florentissimum]|uniref:protein translocase subunit SecF n=1 Tax=Pampinifervens florentissimum TaxID=1632019 RepID=UPI0013B48470|nr:protein translocase subunit SecF [Hydrogenobacter sp. T-8]QID32501.1 protein translocase subunit SecF [Hydrogenobacter sp. T-8]